MTTLEPEQKDILEKLNEIALEENWGTVDRVHTAECPNGIPKGVAVIMEAIEEIKRLREDEADLRIYEMQMKNGEIDMTLGSEHADAFISGLLQIFAQNGAKNFLTTDVGFIEDGQLYTLTIQKVGGQTPAEKLNTLRDEVRKETAKKILQEYSQALIDEFVESGNNQCNTTVAKVLRRICPEIVTNILYRYADKCGVTIDEKNS